MEERTNRGPKATRVCQHGDVRNTRAMSLLRFDPFEFLFITLVRLHLIFFPYSLYFSDFLCFNANSYRSLIFFERSARLNFYRSFPPLRVELPLLFRLVIICFVSIFLSLYALGPAISPRVLAARSSPSTRLRFLCALQRFSRFRAA